MMDTDTPGTDAAVARARPFRQRIGTYLRDLRHAALTGPDDPPPFSRLPGSRPLGVGMAVLVALALLAVLGLYVIPIFTPLLLLGWSGMIVAAMLGVAILLLGLRRPLLAWRVTWLLAVYQVVAGMFQDLALIHPGWWAGVGALPYLEASPIQPALSLAAMVFLVAASQDRGVVVWVWLLTVGVVVSEFANAANFPAYDLHLHQLASALALGVVPVTAGAVLGQLVRHLSRTRRQLVEVEERGLVLDERARIARELHDVVAHHVSLIAVRAETAPYRLAGLPDAAREEFAEISQISRESLTEMRRLLGVLRSDGPPPTAPQPGLADLAELMEWIRATGTPVRLETHGSMAGLPAAVDVSAYRILQEALTNAARHATGAAVRLRLQRTASELTLSVRNDPPPGRAGGGHGAAPAGEGGHGVRGMRERAAMLGGELHAGPTADGGFEIAATLPLRGDQA